MKTKTCCRCGETKQTHMFVLARGRRQSYCKACESKRTNEFNKRNREEINQKCRARTQVLHRLEELIAVKRLVLEILEYFLVEPTAGIAKTRRELSELQYILMGE